MPTSHKFIVFFIVLVLMACDSQKKTIDKKPVPEQTEIVNPDTDLALAGAINFEDEESLTIYSAILKNVIGDKAGAYVGNQMDKLAASLQNNMSYSELLRAGEGLVLEFNTSSDLYFDTGKTTLNSSSEQLLGKILMALKKFPKINVIVETHTDSSGDEDINMKMTNERVTSIAAYLINNGIEQSRLKTKAFGENQPKYKNDSSENRAKNRRVEFGFYASESLKEEARNMTD